MEPFTDAEQKLLKKILDRLVSAQSLKSEGVPRDCAFSGPLLDKLVDVFALLLAKP